MGVALYFYPRQTLSLIRRYLAEGNNPDQQVGWSVAPHADIRVHVAGAGQVVRRIGSPETLELADAAFSNA